MSRTPEHHLHQIRQLIPQPSVEDVGIQQALGRQTAAPIEAKWDSPRFDNSQMDGFAVSPDQLEGGTFPVGPTIPAGLDPSGLYPNGLSHDIAPIMTGAQLPKNTAAVIPVENTQPGTFDVQHATIPATTHGTFLRLKGSDIKAGTEIIPAGTTLNPVHIGVLASQSIERVTVVTKPTVLIVTGGSEITFEITTVATRSTATIPDANGPLLQALCQRNNIDVAAHLKTNDDPKRLKTELERAIDRHQPDVVITSGGISHGKFEVIGQILEDTPEAWFGHVDQQPGGPQGLAKFFDTPVICLPGNPISTLVSFTLFVKPAVKPAVNPAVSQENYTTAFLTHQVQGLPDHREQFLRGTLHTQDGQLKVTPIPGAGSHLLVQAAMADCLIRVPARTTVEENSVVKIYPL
ncbi:molybdopterin biosynthesis enzyme [Corynebacterium deserti GIMN1.010]|uniref:Molybdopterin molybdenumtransferase n=1 Tax=Corynebacterium deserti GIMN1.010 TaxID=931089 RepID=A0A0M3Q8X8_9CORY|nr:molybdopterin molybdotransferase MoeA [Corynebacterium deserti]ALC04719.1 molybdopterin biosynthesis enzyme [Corynebacterium deserti GIMN1.010]